MMLRKKRNNENQLKDKVAMKLAKLLLKIQVKFSKFMSKSVNKVSAKRLKIWLIVFCLLGGGFSIYLITGSIFQSKISEFKIEAINVPKVSNHESNLRSEQFVDEDFYKAIESFDQFMDSLRQTKLGLKIYDSISKVRPGLLDSIKLLKQNYKSQN
jgi:hypothetical protein